MKKWLCLLIALLLPLTAFAAETAPTALDTALADGKQIVTTFSITPGAELSQIEAVADICRSFTFQLYQFKDNYGALSLLLDGEEALALNMKTNEDGLYLDAKALYPQPLYFSFADLQTYMTQVMEASGNATFGAGAASSMAFDQAALTELQETMLSGKEMSDEEMKAALTKALNGDEKFAQWTMDMIKRAVITEGEAADDKSGNHDPADKKLEMVMTQDDIVTLMDTDYMRKSIEQQVEAEAMTSETAMTDEEKAAKVQAYLDEAKTEIADMEMLMPITCLYSGEDVVSLSCPMTIKQKAKDPQESKSMAMNMDYDRLTTDGKAAHSFQMKVSETEPKAEDVMEMQGFFRENADGSYELSFDAYEYGEQKIVIQGKYANTAEGISGLGRIAIIDEKTEVFFKLDGKTTDTANDTTLSIYVKENVIEFGVLTEADKPFISFNVSTAVKEDDGRFAALDSATPASSAQVLQMDGSQLSSFISELSGNGTQLLFNILSKLPPSLFSLVMTGQ